MTSIIEVLRSVKVLLCRGVDGQDGGLSATSIWRAHFRSIFVLSKGLLQIVVNVKLNEYHCFGKCNSSLIPRVPILGFFFLFRFVVMKKSCCSHFIFNGVVQQVYLTFSLCIISSFNSSTTFKLTSPSL